MREPMRNIYEILDVESDAHIELTHQSGRGDVVSISGNGQTVALGMFVLLNSFFSKAFGKLDPKNVEDFFEMYKGFVAMTNSEHAAVCTVDLNAAKEQAEEQTGG